MLALRPTHVLAARLALWSAAGLGAAAQGSPAPPAAAPKEAAVTHVSGRFDVELTPQTPDGAYEDAALGRMRIDKQYHGDLEATGRGQMLTALTSEKGSAGYVAIERVSGSLRGRRGTFVLQHSGTMNRGAPQLSLHVVPDSGTGQLAGLAGTMAIRIEAGGAHFYDFDYSLPPAP